MGLPPGDYRTESYLRYAEERFISARSLSTEELARAKREARRQGYGDNWKAYLADKRRKEESVNINPSNLVEGTGQVAVRGGISENVQVTEAGKTYNLPEYEKKKAEEAQRQSVTIAIDKQAVEEYNQNLASQGIRNAEDYFKTVRKNTTPQYYPGKYTLVAPRTINPEETISQDFAAEYTPPDTFTTEGISQVKTPQSEAKKISLFLADREEPTRRALSGIPAPLAVPTMAAAGFTSGLIRAGQGTGRFITETIIGQFPKKISDVPKYVAYDLFGNIITGTSEYLGETVTAIVTLNPYKIGQAAGEFTAYEKIGRITKETAREAVTSLNLPANAAALKAKIAFEEAKASTPLDIGYEFTTTSYDMQGRKGVIVPPEYEGLGIRPQTIEGTQLARVAPELQTQLYPKKLTGQEYQAYLEREGLTLPGQAPTGFIELARKEPQLAKELAKESGQTVFNPETPAYVRDLTPQERLNIAKEQAGIKKEILQKTLPETIPTGQNKIILLKDGKPILEQESTRLEAPLFALEPLSAVAITITREAPQIMGEIKGVLRDFKRERIEINEGSVSKAIKEPSSEPFGIIRENIISGGKEKINITSIGLPNQPTKNPQLPKLNPKIKALNEQSPTQAPLPRSRQPLGSATITETATRQIQENALISEQIPAQINPPKTTARTIQIQNPNTPPPSDKGAFFNTPRREELNEGGTFSTLVRRGGRFQVIGTSPTEAAAKRLGELTLKETAAASFKITTGGETVELSPGFGFTRSKKERGVIIQPREKRISSAGEKREITYKGIFTSKTKKGLKKAFNFFGG